jgi:hypothetical protein
MREIGRSPHAAPVSGPPGVIVQDGQAIAYLPITSLINDPQVRVCYIAVFSSLWCILRTYF